MKIDSIYVNEVGRITKATLSLPNPDTGSKQVYTFNREQFLSKIKQGAIKNVYLQNEDIVIKVPNNSNEGTNPINFKWEPDYTYSFPDCKIKHIEVLVEEFEHVIEDADCYFVDIYQVVDKLSLTVEGELKERLIHLGFKEAPNNHIEANHTILYALISKNEYLKNVFDNIGLRIMKTEHDMEEIVYSQKRNCYDFITTVTTHNSYKDTLNAWINKAKLLGIYNDYEIKGQTQLVGYSGKEKCPIIPPVKMLAFYSFLPSNNIKELNIPDSVKYISSNHFYRLEKVNLGENLIKIYSGLFYDTPLKEINTGNLTKPINLPRHIEKITINTIYLDEYSGYLFKNNAKIKELIIRETRWDT